LSIPTADIEPSSCSTFETWVAAKVVAGAVHDYHSPHAELRESARAFFFDDDGGCEWWCDAVGWDHEWIRRKVVELGPATKAVPGRRAFRRTGKPPNDALVLARRRLGLTQKQLAEMSGVARGSIMRYELGLRMPKPSERDAILRVLKLEAWPEIEVAA
jgi:hypothetical protein